MINVIHNTYEKNRHLRESAILNINALRTTELAFNYIIFNDHGDESIYDDVKDLLYVDGRHTIQYIYSDINHGMGICSGGWIGAIPYLKGYNRYGLIHNIGQDDVYTPLFYTSMFQRLSDPDIYLAYANGFKAYPNLTLTGETLGPIQELDYWNYEAMFNHWFGVQDSKVTRANNFIPAPGVMYKTTLHERIGLPDLATFKGSADFEYWARTLFSGNKISYDPRPLWLYRMSEYSLGSKPLAERETPNWNNLIKNRYQEWLTQSLLGEQVLSPRILQKQ
jgi:hypothetical protein